MEEYKLEGGERKTTKEKRKGWGEKGVGKKRGGVKKAYGKEEWGKEEGGRPRDEGEREANLSN